MHKRGEWRTAVKNCRPLFFTQGMHDQDCGLPRCSRDDTDAPSIVEVNPALDIFDGKATRYLFSSEQYAQLEVLIFTFPGAPNLRHRAIFYISASTISCPEGTMSRAAR
jgi:hypothetical protein